MKNIITLKNISKSYESEGLKIHVLDKVSLSIDSNENSGFITSILAPVGSGKTTLLKILSGIESEFDGDIERNSEQKKLPLIPEEPVSYPWMSVKENIEFVQKNTQIKSSVSYNHFVSMVGLTGYKHHIPHHKSLGFRFRISLARALAAEPELILIDDSLKNMDPETKDEIYQLIQNLASQHGVNFLIATTNISEAIFISNKIYLMKNDPGKIFNEVILNDNKDEVEIRRSIEKLYQSEKVVKRINFSV